LKALLQFLISCQATRRSTDGTDRRTSVVAETSRAPGHMALATRISNSNQRNIVHSPSIITSKLPMPYFSDLWYPLQRLAFVNCHMLICRAHQSSLTTIFKHTGNYQKLLARVKKGVKNGNASATAYHYQPPTKIPPHSSTLSYFPFFASIDWSTPSFSVITSPETRGPKLKKEKEAREFTAGITSDVLAEANSLNCSVISGTLGTPGELSPAHPAKPMTPAQDRHENDTSSSPSPKCSNEEG
jgi:hypothetical protein